MRFAMSVTHLVLAIVAVWRVTHLLHAEDGPFRIFERGRDALRRISFSGAVDCFYCLSIWVAIPFAVPFSHSVSEAGTVVLALSGLAILLNRIAAPATEPAAAFFEEPILEENPSCAAVEAKPPSDPSLRTPEPELSMQ